MGESQLPTVEVDPSTTPAKASDAPSTPTPTKPVTGVAHWPGAVLLQLFQQCQAMSPQFSPDPVILPISQTCEHWRRIALGNPSLWTNVYLGFDRMDMGLAFIDRARGQPLAVYISSQRKKIGEKTMDRFSNALAESLNTWREVTIQECSHRRMSLMIYSVFVSRTWVVELGKLTLKQTSEKPLKAKDTACLANIFSDQGLRVSALRECRMWRCPVLWANLRARTLTLLDIRHVPKQFFPAWTGFTEIIKAAVCLEHLVLIDVELGLPPYRMPYPSLLLPSLVSLTISLCNGDDIHNTNPTFLKAIKTAPKLLTLVVSHIGELSQFAETGLHPMDKFPELTSLSLLYAGLTTPVSDAFFEATKKLKFFRIIMKSEGCIQLFDRVLEKNSWPNLEQIIVVKGKGVATTDDIKVDDAQVDELDAISKLVEGRKASGQEIRFVDLTEESDFITEILHYQGGFVLEEPYNLLGDGTSRPWWHFIIDIDSDPDSELDSIGGHR